jgi:hypothetical protein
MITLPKGMVVINGDKASEVRNFYNKTANLVPALSPLVTTAIILPLLDFNLLLTILSNGLV